MSDTQTCGGCGRGYASPAAGAGGAPVCPSCGAPVGQGQSNDDTAAFQRFYSAPTQGTGGLRGLLSRLFGRR